MTAPEYVEIGDALMRRREKLGFSVQYISSRLLLSTQQVRDLEAGSSRAFYNRGLYLRALRRYADFVQVPQELVARVIGLNIRPVPTPAPPPRPSVLKSSVTSALSLLDHWRRRHAVSHATSTRS